MPSTIGPLLMMALQKMPQPGNLSLEEVPELYLKEPSTGRAYVCLCASRNLFEALDAGETVNVYTAQVIREDAEQIFVFSNVLERELFLELRNLDSIGAKTAAAFLWHFGIEGLRGATQSQNFNPGKAPGLGPKTMEKILTQLWAKREKLLPILPSQILKPALSNLSAASVDPTSSVRGDSAPVTVLQTMEKLGLKTQETQKLWKELCAEDPEIINLEKAELLKRLLQGWGRVKSIVSSPGSQELS